MSEFLTVDELADLLRTSSSALYTQRHRGEAPGALGVQVGRKILYERDAVLSWFRGQRNDAAQKSDAANFATTAAKRGGQHA